MKHQQIRAELEQIALKNGGTLRPADVVAFARNPKTALHSQFTWDDTKAAEQYRLWQARQVIRVTVTVEADDQPERRVFVSLMGDRTSDAGYRLLADVMSDEQMRAQLLAEAREEMQVFMRKYQRLEELAQVFDAMRAHLAKPKRRARA